MSSGQKWAAEQEEEQAKTKHFSRLQKLSVHDLARIGLELNRALDLLERASVAMPRSGWAALDAAITQARKLS